MNVGQKSMLFKWAFTRALTHLMLYFESHITSIAFRVISASSLHSGKPVEIEQIGNREMTPFTSLPRNTQRGKFLTM